MSIVSKRAVHELPAKYREVETELDCNNETEYFQGFANQTDLKTQSKIRSPKKNVPVVYETISLDSSSDTEIGENLDVESCPGKKRRRTHSASSEETVEPRSRSASPEISYGGQPVIYKLKEEDGRFFIVKVPMTSKRETRRTKKCSEQDISLLLDTEDEEEQTIFDSPAKSRGHVVATLQNGSKHLESPCTPKRTKGQLPNVNGELDSPKGTPSRTKALQKEEVSLKIKLRRSTEQSNYKIQAVEPEEPSPRRSSRRSNIGTPKRCGLGDCDEDHTVHAIARKTPQRSTKKNNILKETAPTTPAPRRSRRISEAQYNSDDPELKSLHNKENESEDDNKMDVDSDHSLRRSTRVKSRSATPQLDEKILKDTNKETPRKNSRTIKEINTPSRGYLENVYVIEADDYIEKSSSRERSTRKKKLETPQKQIKKADEVVSTPSSSRPRRNSRLVNYNYDLENELGEKEKESDEEKEKVTTRRTRRTPSTSQISATPQKQRKVLEEASTPRRTPRSSAALLDEAATPRRTSRRSVLKSVEEEATPKKTPRRSILQSVEEEAAVTRTPRKTAAQSSETAATPRKTPRRAAAQRLEELSTPKKKPETIAEIDEPKTPSTVRKRNFKAVTPSVKLGSLTPSMTRRTANVGKPKTILEEARAQLHVSTVPKSLPCRDDEFNDIFRFLEGKLLDKSSGCIYISGVPGTGKTATVTEAIRALKRLVAKGELDDFDYVGINGMKLSEPRQAYVQILKQINGQTVTWEQAHGILDKRFRMSKAKRPMTLLLVDELDLLCNKRQDVVYNLLDWPTTRNAQLVVITIANTMDLPERILMSRVTSRLGLTRLTFQPYTFKQLQEIVTTRLKDSDAFRSEAIQLVSRKVAAVSGDARRALDICRRATEITELKSEKTVTMQHVNEALQEMISSAKVVAIKTCSEMEKYYLRAVDAEVTRTGVEEVTFQNVYRQLTSICALEGIKTPNVTQTLSVCSRLGAYRLLLCEQTKNDADRRIILNVSSDDIHFATQNVDIS